MRRGRGAAERRGRTRNRREERRGKRDTAGRARDRRGRCTGDVQGWRRGRSAGGAAEEAWEEVWEMHGRRMAGDAQEMRGRGPNTSSAEVSNELKVDLS